MKRSKQTKKALTGSVLALVLCFVMLLGTTFAWFTDTASTGVSTIQAGTLDIELQKYENGEWVTVKENEELSFLQAGSTGGSSTTADDKEIEASSILWEPNCTYALPKLRVVNNGNLALEYKIVVTAAVGDVNLAEVLDVYYTGNLSVTKDGETKTDTVTKQKVGTLNGILTSTDEDGFAHGVLTGGSNSGDMTIALHMQETAGNQYQGQTITGITVDVYAKQYTYEYDSNDNQYDKDAEYVSYTKAPADATEVATLDQLETALATGGNIHLTADITLSKKMQISNSNAAIYSEGKKITAASEISGNAIELENSTIALYGVSVSNISATNYIINLNGSTLTIGNQTKINNNTATERLIAATLGSDIVMEDGAEISGNKSGTQVIFVSRAVDGKKGSTFTMNGGSINNNTTSKDSIYTEWNYGAGLIAVSDGASMTMNGGEIINNTVGNCAAGVLTTRLGTITLNKGTIKGNKGAKTYTNCTSHTDLTTCISSHEVGLYNNVGQITISADCVLEGTNHGSGMGGYKAGQAYDNRDYWPNHGENVKPTRPVTNT